MTQYKPFLMIKRLVILKGNKRVYDELFTPGVNIIRGENSSGKSTISDFIFYGIGGDLTKLKEEAKSCDFVFVETNLSGHTFTLKREIKEGGRKGMDIFSGDFESSYTAAAHAWSRHPYNANTKESFYQVIFKELGMPYSTSEDKNSLTMHQLLRMMYVDQMTSPDRLFKFDRFDSPNKRKAIGELLIGLSDFSLYEKRVNLQKLETTLDSRIKEINTIHTFLGSTIKSIEEIGNEISNKQSEIIEIENSINCFTGEGDLSESKQEDDIIETLLIDIEKARKEQSYLHDEIAKNSFEINDSLSFIISLESRIVALKETKKTINVLSDIAFHHCPACQAELVKSTSGCILCKHTHDTYIEGDVDPTFKVRKEIEFQIAESSKLIDIKQKRLGKYEINLNQNNTRLELLKKELDFIRKPQVAISTNLLLKFKEIGSLKNQINTLNNSKEEFSKLYNLYDERKALQNNVNSLQAEVNRIEAKIANKLTNKKNQLGNITLEILRADKEHEDIFNEGKVIEFDFGEDRVTIDERALFSASSMVYLKNAFRLAMLKASCDDPSYLYPRFLLMDNVEDKGMTDDRSQLFQREIIKMSKSISVEHQIIFTTSAIDSGLDGSKYCVGDFYHKENKTLKF